MTNYIKNKHAAGSYTLMAFGAVNTIHGLSHIAQALQSVVLASNSFAGHDHAHESGNVLEQIVETTVHNPIAGFVWAGIGIGSMYLAYCDRKHHKKMHAELAYYKRLAEDKKAP